MNRSFYNGISGIKTHQFGLDVWANNIANINKTAYKAATPEFSTIFSQSLTKLPTTPTSNDIGLGSRASATTVQFKQGSITKTENPFDLALNGEGWFGVVTPAGERLYTRAGLFNKDASGYLTDAEGNFLLGTVTNNIQDGAVVKNPVTDISLKAPGAQEKILLQDDVIMPAVATSQVTLKGALDSKPIYKLLPDNSKIEIPNKERYQSILINPDGTSSTLEINFTKKVPQERDRTVWSAEALIYDADRNIVTKKEGVLTFNDRGALIDNTLHEIDNNGTNVKLNIGSIYNPQIPNSGFDGLFSYHGGEEYFSKSVQQNGKKAGLLTGYSVENNGMIIAGFDNGDTVPVAQIALYHFQNNSGLEQSSPIYFKETANSGEPLFFLDKNGKSIDTTAITSHALETANVSTGEALTELIIMQKAFDASAKSITTSDQLIQNAINMKK